MAQDGFPVAGAGQAHNAATLGISDPQNQVPTSQNPAGQFMAKLAQLAAAGVDVGTAYQQIFGQPLNPADGNQQAFIKAYQALLGGSTDPGQESTVAAGSPGNQDAKTMNTGKLNTTPPGPVQPDPNASASIASNEAAGLNNQPATPPEEGGTTNNANQPAASAPPPGGQPPAGGAAGAAQPPAAGAQPPAAGGAPGTQTLNPANANQGNPTEYEYGFDPNRDSLTSWAGHAFQRATGLGSVTDTNGAPLNPYQSWVKQRYGNQVPISSMLQYLTDGSSGNGPGGVGPQGADTIGALSAFNQGPTSASGSGMDNLRTLADLAQRVHDNSTDGISQDRVNMLQGMQGEQGANEAMSLALAAYTQKYGNLGSDQMMKRMNDARTQYYGNSALSSGQTPFLDFLLKNTGMVQ